MKWENLPSTNTPLNAQNLNGTTLYESANGTNGNITLSETADNFDYIEIFGHRTNTSLHTKVKYKSGNFISLNFSRYISPNMYVYALVFKITGTALTRDSEGLMYIGNNGAPIYVTSSADIYIDKIVGY